MRFVVLLPLLLVGAAIASAASADDRTIFTGQATAVTAPLGMDDGGLIACQLQDLSPYFERFYAYLPSSQFDIGQHCGRCLRVKGLDAGSSDISFTLMVVDECIHCDDSSLDMSAEALEALSGSLVGTTQISWQFAACDEDAGLAPVDLTQLADGGADTSGKKRRRKDSSVTTDSEGDAAPDAPPPPPLEPASRKLLLRLRR